MKNHIFTNKNKKLINNIEKNKIAIYVNGTKKVKSTFRLKVKGEEIVV